MTGYFFIFILIFQLDNVVAGDIPIKKHESLFNTLKSPKDWKLINQDNGLTLSVKPISGMELAAYRVQKRTDVPIDVVQNIIMDVKNYDKYFNKNQSPAFKQLEQGPGWVEGHHYLPISIPLVKDREYFFRVHTNGYNNEDTTSIVHWYLIKNPKDKNEELNKQTIILNYGAGLWMADSYNDTTYVLSYCLFLDPGGSIPDFAVELINKANIINIFQDVIAEASSNTIKTLP